MVLLMRPAAGAALSFAIVARAFRQESLDFSGALAAFLVMAIHITASDRFGALLLVFFFTSSKMTKIGAEKRRDIDGDFTEGGRRNWLQVLANSWLATVLVLAVWIITEGTGMCLDTKESTLITGLVGGIIGHYACWNGDTWSSEIGLLSNSKPRLITSFKTVPKGINGAVTIKGLVAAAAAGFCVGLGYVIAELITNECSTDISWTQFLVIPVATAAGLLGSMIDSLLGATLQFSGYCRLRKKVVGKRGATVTKISGRMLLDNNAVNAVSMILTTLLTSFACLYIF